MAIDKSQICVTRSLSRYPASAQRDALSACGCGTWFDLAERGERARFVGSIRRGDTIHVRHLHLLAEPKRRTDDVPRLTLWAILFEIEDRGAVIREISTGRSTASKRERDMMIRDALEVLTKGARANAARQARENGKLGGRKRKWQREKVEAAAAVWFDDKLSGDALDAALRRGRHPPRHYLQKPPPTGLGPRWGTGKE